jgi:hypothetical protein
MAECFRYPAKRITESDDYLQILIVNYVPPGVSTNPSNLIQRTSTQALADSGNLTNSLYQILLPMPQGISDSNMVDWGDDSLNPLAAYALGASKNIMTGTDSPLEAGKNLMSTIKNVATSGNGQDLVTNYMAAMAVNNLGANISAESLLSRSEGKILNPNMELLFKGVQLRSFNFTFNMSPRDDVESKSVKSIIRAFKKSMAAKTSTGTGAGLFIDSPNVFQLEYRSGGEKHPFLNSFKPCALTNMAVDYTASGAYATYEDATPVHMKLTLSFQELNPVYFSDYDDSTDIGVGY